MNLRITVHTEGRFCDSAASMTVPDPMVEAFEPLKTCDDSMMAYMSGDVLPESFEYTKKLKLRKNAAEYLAKVIANHLILEMQKNDTHNGYKKDNQ